MLINTHLVKDFLGKKHLICCFAYNSAFCVACFIQILVPEINTHSGWKPVFHLLMAMVRTVLLHFVLLTVLFTFPNVEMTDSVGNGHASFSVLIVFE